MRQHWGVILGALICASGYAQTSQPASRPAEHIEAEFNKALLAHLKKQDWSSRIALAGIDCDDCPEINAVKQTMRKGDANKMVSELNAHPLLMSRYIKDIARSCYDFSPLTPTLLGMRRADLDYAMGKPQIEVYGLIITDTFLDVASGLPLKLHGCTSMCSEMEEADAYNHRLRELVARGGPPPTFKGLKERYLKSRHFKSTRPRLEWVNLRLTESNSSHQEAQVGSVLLLYELEPDAMKYYVHLKARLLPNEPARTVLVPQAKQGKMAVEAAWWRGADTLVFHDLLNDSFSFVDPVSMTVMWTFRPEMDELLNRLSATSQAASQPAER